ncbi:MULTISPECIES: response regulator [unclassified Pseudoalteromonas]|uniref:response regulator n=1 Tax=unclassified Pseudoalteromonas TaxID=194690 RepID=UPI000A5BB83E|nr:MULTISPECIES: response regulator [unclassified Pseudoalteromonas]
MAVDQMLYMPNILVVEDDVELCEWMCEYLSAKGYQVTSTGRGDEAVTLINKINPDLVVLDGMLPGLDGFDVCKAVRPNFKNTIIMVTARDEEIDEVLGLEMGADEYLTKPVRARALLTRIKKHLDRQQEHATHIEQAAIEKNTDRLKFNNLIIDRQAMTVSLDGEQVKISTNEFDVLWLLAQQAGTPVSRSELVSQLRGFDYDGFDRSIDLRISRLRKKLRDDSSEPFRIKTIWGKGYLFAKDAW